MIITQLQGPGQIRPPPGNISPQGVFPAPPTEPLTRLALLSLHVSVIPMRRCHHVGPVFRPLPPSCTIPSQCQLPSWAVSTSLTPLEPILHLGWGPRSVSSPLLLPLASLRLSPHRHVPLRHRHRCFHHVVLSQLRSPHPEWRDKLPCSTPGTQGDTLAIPF